jgi:hypothetical protein
MYRVVGGVLLLLMALPALRAEDKPKDRPTTPQEKYQALLKAYEDESNGKRFGEQLQLAAEKYAPQFLDLAEKNPKDPAAVDALIWVVKTLREPQKDGPRTKALDLLTRDHAQSDKLGPLCQKLALAVDTPSGDLLRASLDKSPSRDLQGEACFSLAQYLRNRSQYLAQLKENPDGAERLEQQLGKEYLAELKKLDTTQVDKEVEELFERAATKYADVKLSGGGTLGPRAKKELALVRIKTAPAPEVGKTTPEIEGEDLEGKKFKLSDYRGKVVLLDFWGNW